MFDRWLGRRQGSEAARLFAPHMPEVDVLPGIEATFDTARRAAAGEGELPTRGAGRHVVIITPGRMLMFQPCPPAGSMPPAQVAAIEQMIPRAVRRNIAAIASTELPAVQTDAARAIPFLGFLLGFAYIGHAVWVFEGHASALAAGCRDADVLLVDGGMAPHLQQDWQAVAAGAMRRAEIYVHDRTTFTLRRIRPA